MATATAIIAVSIAATAALDPEKKGRQFHLEHLASTNTAQPTNDPKVGKIENTSTPYDEEEDSPELRT